MTAYRTNLISKSWDLTTYLAGWLNTTLSLFLVGEVMQWWTDWERYMLGWSHSVDKSNNEFSTPNFSGSSVSSIVVFHSVTGFGYIPYPS